MKFSLLLKTGIGDSYGAGFEYASDGHVTKYNTLSGYVKNEKHNLLAGRYTDDTQMALAVAEVIISGIITREAFADAFVKCFKRDEREGYARGFQLFLEQVADGAAFLSTIKPYSDKSGGAMRAVPCAIFPTIDRVKEIAALQARLTHDTTDGVNAAVAAALMGHYFLYELGPKGDLGTFLEKHVTGEHCDWATPWTGPVGQKGWMAVHAAVSAVIANDSLSAILKACVGYTGDVDTVAAVALGAASASTEVTDDLPEFAEADLENGTYGRDYLKSIDVQLQATMASLKAQG
jgi:ADP-ribosylglycohydrolase